MSFVAATEPSAMQALALAERLQTSLTAALERVAVDGAAGDAAFAAVTWLRDGGRHGGGRRFVAADTPVFNRASVNVSQVHYTDLPDKRLSSATALSAIIHPASPRAPSMHTHVSWTHMRDGRGYWRMMADLNPSHEVAADTARFSEALAEVAGELYLGAAQQGDRYFTIPALGRTRGASHFYLEAFATADPAADATLAARFGEGVIAVYEQILGLALARPALDAAAAQRQIDYHTLYAFQVLTLDRGTTSGLLVHDQNDVGILGSLPAVLNRELLKRWRAKVPAAQVPLVDALVEALPTGERCYVDHPTKLKLAAAVRRFYAEHPAALELQAAGNVVPPTVQNHR